jgi:cysteine-rich repeat protein
VRAAQAIVVPDDYPTIQAALDAAVPGDTISVKDTAGPYFEKITIPTSGSPGAYVTLQAFAGHSPILDGTGVPGSNMVLIDSKSYVRLIGFEIRNNLGVHDGSGVRVLGSGSHVEIRDNRIHDIRGQDAMGITVYGTEPISISNLVIDGNEIHDCEPARSEALTLNGNVEIFAVTNNIVRDVNNIGIDFIGGETDIQPDPSKVARNGVCSGNQVYRARSSYGGGYAGGIYVDGGRDIVIERNIVSECDLGIEIGAENAGTTTTGIIVRDNIVHRNDKVGIVFGGFAASVGRVKDCSFLNNTCYQNDTLGEGLGELWIQFAEDNAIRNNIFHATAQGVLLYSENGNVNNALDYNLWHADAGNPTFVWQGNAYGSFAAYQGGSGQDANSWFADPQLMDPAGEDFHLASTSPAVDAGDPAFIPGAGENDIDGAPRVSGLRVDLGADEINCGDGILDPTEVCDDHNLIDCDGCDSNCTASGTCGNGITCAPEQCDDGNTAGADCCSATCSFEASGAPCTDGDLCTIGDQCDGAGACDGSAEPEPVCRPSGRSLLLLRDKDPDTRDTLVWRWIRGEDTDVLDLGDPRGATEYALCIYDQSANPQPLYAAEVPAGTTCGSKPCWKAINGGFRYRDKSRAARGVLTLRIRAGVQEKSRISVRGKGVNLALPALGLTEPVTVQLRNDLDHCWGATYTTSIRNDADLFKAK